jgi:hypothetical protein
MKRSFAENLGLLLLPFKTGHEAQKVQTRGLEVQV